MSLPAVAQTPPADAVPQAAPQTAPQPTAVEPAPEPEPQAIPPAPEAPARKPDGFFDVLNRWMDKSARDFKASVEDSNAKWKALNDKNAKAAKEAALEAAAAQKEAAEAFKNLSNVKIIEARKTCKVAKNGSPDCQAAAEAICRNKGFGAGKSADIQTTRKCSAKAWLNREESECRTETVVVKAACSPAGG